jgi:hypothetical protein
MDTIDNLFEFKSLLQQFSHLGQCRLAKQASADIWLIGNYKQTEIEVIDLLKS